MKRDDTTPSLSPHFACPHPPWGDGSNDEDLVGLTNAIFPNRILEVTNGICSDRIVEKLFVIDPERLVDAAAVELFFLSASSVRGSTVLMPLVAKGLGRFLRFFSGIPEIRVPDSTRGTDFPMRSGFH